MRPKNIYLGSFRTKDEAIAAIRAGEIVSVTVPDTERKAAPVGAASREIYSSAFRLKITHLPSIGRELS